MAFAPRISYLLGNTLALRYILSKLKIHCLWKSSHCFISILYLLSTRGLCTCTDEVSSGCSYLVLTQTQSFCPCTPHWILFLESTSGCEPPIFSPDLTIPTSSPPVSCALAPQGRASWKTARFSPWPWPLFPTSSRVHLQCGRRTGQRDAPRSS